MRTSSRSRAGALLVLAALVISPFPPSAMASGDAIADKRAEAERIARQLEQQSRQVSILAEDYDEARVRIAKVETELAGAEATVKKTDEQAGAIRARVKEQAVQAYIRGGAAPALAMLADTRTSDDIAIRSQYIRTVTSGAVDVLDELRAVRLELDGQRERLAEAKAQAKTAADQAEAKGLLAAAAQAAQVKTLRTVQGELAALVEAEAARRAEEQARRAQAELAAKAAKAKADADAKAAREAAAREAARSATTTTTRPAGGTAGTVRSAPTTTTTRPNTTTTAPPGSTSTGPPAAGADAAIAEAQRQLGKPYEYGGSGPDTFDCSGLTSWAWRAGAKTLSHSSRAQYAETSRVAFDAIQRGDLLFYGDPIHHVGLYIGDGQMIEAPETGKTVRIASIYRSGYTGAGRVN